MSPPYSLGFTIKDVANMMTYLLNEFPQPCPEIRRIEVCGDYNGNYTVNIGDFINFVFLFGNL